MDLIRRILLTIDADPQTSLLDVPAFEDISTNIVVEHVRLLRESGLIDAVDVSTMSGPDYIQLRLTWAGHDLVETFRDPEIWVKTKAGAKSVGTWSISLLAEMAKGFAKQKAAELGLPIIA